MSDFIFILFSKLGLPLELFRHNRKAINRNLEQHFGEQPVNTDFIFRDINETYRLFVINVSFLVWLLSD